MLFKKILFVASFFTIIFIISPTLPRVQAQTTNGWYLVKSLPYITNHWITFNSDTFVSPPQSQEFGFFDTCIFFAESTIVWEKTYPTTYQIPYWFRYSVYLACWSQYIHVTSWIALIHGDTVFWVARGNYVQPWQWLTYNYTFSTPPMAAFNKIRLAFSHCDGQAGVVRVLVDQIMGAIPGQPWIVYDSMHLSSGIEEKPISNLVFSFSMTKAGIYNVLGQKINSEKLGRGIYFVFVPSGQKMKKIIIK